MEIETQTANIIWTMVLVVGLYFVWDRLVVPLMRETLRRKLFHLRREMFLFMTDGGIDPDHLAYGMLRSRMNSSIRFADGLSLTRVVVAVITVGNECRLVTKKLDEAIGSLPYEAKRKMAQFRKQSALAVGWFIVGRSPTFWILATIAIPLIVAAAIVAFVISLAKQACVKSWAEMVEIMWRRADKGAAGIDCLDEEEESLLAA
jgi:hypothetical protein